MKKEKNIHSSSSVDHNVQRQNILEHAAFFDSRGWFYHHGIKFYIQINSSENGLTVVELYNHLIESLVTNYPTPITTERQLEYLFSDRATSILSPEHAEVIRLIMALSCAEAHFGLDDTLNIIRALRQYNMRPALFLSLDSSPIYNRLVRKFAMQPYTMVYHQATMPSIFAEKHCAEPTISGSNLFEILGLTIPEISNLEDPITEAEPSPDVDCTPSSTHEVGEVFATTSEKDVETYSISLAPRVESSVQWTSKGDYHNRTNSHRATYLSAQLDLIDCMSSVPFEQRCGCDIHKFRRYSFLRYCVPP